MVEAARTSLAAWSDFYVIVGSAAGGTHRFAVRGNGTRKRNAATGERADDFCV